jgi:hypothetical protein
MPAARMPRRAHRRHAAAPYRASGLVLWHKSGVRERRDGRIVYGVLDPAAFVSDGGPSIAERMARRGVHFRRADQRPRGAARRAGRLDQLRARLRREGDRPGIFMFSTCWR